MHICQNTFKCLHMFSVFIHGVYILLIHWPLSKFNANLPVLSISCQTEIPVPHTRTHIHYTIVWIWLCPELCASYHCHSHWPIYKEEWDQEAERDGIRLQKQIDEEEVRQPRRPRQHIRSIYYTRWKQCIVRMFYTRTRNID